MRAREVSPAWKATRSLGATVVGWAAGYGFYALYMICFSGFRRPTDDNRPFFELARFTTFGAVAGLVVFMALVGWWTGLWRTLLFPAYGCVSGAVSGFAYALLLGKKKRESGRKARRSSLPMLAALASLSLAAGLAAAARGQETEPSAVATTAVFAFHSDFEINLHDALLEAGRARWSDRPELFHSGEEAACFTELPRTARAGWDHAVGFYAEAISPPQARAQQFVARLSLIGKEPGEADDRETAAIAAGVRAAAAPAYRACRWRRQDEENRAWVARLLPLLEAHEQTLAEGLADLYGEPLDGLPIRTDMVETVSWSSANTIYLLPEGGHIWVRNTAGEGPVALETVFHEASHLLTGRGAPIPRALEEAARELDVPLPRDLWHGAQFYTTGDLVRRVLAQAGAPGYEPMTFAEDIFGEYHPALEAEWTGYLEGDKTLAEAARDLVRAVAAPQ